MTERRTAEIRAAWTQLFRLAIQMRADWDPDDTRDAIRAVMTAGWPFEQAAREVWRLVWDSDGFPAELRNSARRPRAGKTTGPEVNRNGYAMAMAALEEARTRTTGPMNLTGAEPGS